jgi:hypothetical protein
LGPWAQPDRTTAPARPIAKDETERFIRKTRKSEGRVAFARTPAFSRSDPVASPMAD